MNCRNSIAGLSRRGLRVGITAARLSRAQRRVVALLMLAAFTVRLTGLLPNVAVLHWHGHVEAIHAGGAFPHTYGPADGLPDPEGAPVCGGYFSLSCLSALTEEGAGPAVLAPVPACGPQGPVGIGGALHGPDRIQPRAPPA